MKMTPKEFHALKKKVKEAAGLKNWAPGTIHPWNDPKLVADLVEEVRGQDVAMNSLRMKYAGARKRIEELEKERDWWQEEAKTIAKGRDGWHEEVVRLEAKLERLPERRLEKAALKANDHMQRRERALIEEQDRLERFLPHLVDVVWGEAHEDESVPSTAWARRLIVQARETYVPDAPLPPPCVACGGSGRNRPPGLKMPGWGEVCAKCKGAGIADKEDR